MAKSRDVDPMDVRIIRHGVRRGELSPGELKKYIAGLPDVAEKAETVDEPQPLEPLSEQPKQPEES